MDRMRECSDLSLESCRAERLNTLSTASPGSLTDFSTKKFSFINRDSPTRSVYIDDIAYFDDDVFLPRNQEHFTNSTVDDARPSNYLWLALCTLMFFNPVSGIITVIIAIQVDKEHKKNNCERARNLGKAVRIICIISIAFTICALIVVSALYSSNPSE